MKKYTSVAMVAVRPIVWKLLLIILVMAAVEVGLSFRTQTMLYVRLGNSLALMALTAVILRQGGWLSGGKPGYTMRRMPVSEGITALIWGMIYLAAFAVLRTAQLMTALVIWKMMTGAKGLSLAMWFYSEPILHGLFPMEDWACHIRKILWVVAMASSLSGAAYTRRRGGEPIAPYILLVIELVFMNGQYTQSELEICLLILIVIVMGFAVFHAWGSRYDES